VQNTGHKIHKLEVTTDTLTSRGGLAVFVKYINAIGILALLLNRFARIKKSAKGVSLGNLFLQALYFFCDGTSRHLCYFDELKKDLGYAAVIEMPEEQMASSHAIKRFFGAFNVFHQAAFRWVLRELFLWRLQLQKPNLVILTLDTMVMDNDEAEKREGCDPTYKKVKGFQPLQLIWEGKIVEGIFRRGKRHSNYGRDVSKIIEGTVKLIRGRYDATAPIILLMDSGFLDEKIFTLCDRLRVGFIGTGKTYDAVKEKIAAIPEKDWKEYANEQQAWSYASFVYQCDKWQRGYRAVYTRPVYEDEQRLLEFARPDNIIVSNLAAGEPVLEEMLRDQQKYWLRDDSLIFHHHRRGADELPHRGLKDFGSEELPFQRYACNQAYYYLMVIAFFLFQTFKEDNFQDILPVNSYATTVRRQLLDIAAKIVRTGHEVILKVTQPVMDRLQLQLLWTRCQNHVPIPIVT
jgi:hypothetical protein